MSNQKTFTWTAQFNIGKIGEQLFQETYPEAVKTDGRVEDFILNGEKIELKCDSFSMSKTPNFFYEYYGNQEKKKIGGPWRTAQDNIKYFVYLYLHDKTFFWFNSATLVAFLNEHIKKLKPKYVKNKGYVTTGFVVNREDVKHLMIKPPK